MFGLSKIHECVSRTPHDNNSLNLEETQLIFTCSKSTIETLEKGMKYVQS